MIPLSESDIRSCVVNASRKEISSLSMPTLDAVHWDEIDFLGWQDPKNDRHWTVVVRADDGTPTGVVLTRSTVSPRARALCSWCQDVRLRNDVTFFSVKRPGAAGRNGDTVGILVCEDLQCSQNVRVDPPLPYEGFDLAAERQRRIDVLHGKVASFAADLVSRR